jgi:hypothetical protein
MARLGLGVGLTRRGGGGGAAPTIASLFAGGQQGAWFDPSTLGTLFQKPEDGVEAPVDAAGQSVSRMADRSGRDNHATQETASKRLTYQTAPSPRLTLDKVDDVMGITVPGLGWTGTMVIGTDVGTASYEVTIPAGAYEIGGRGNGKYFPGGALVGQVIRNGSLTAVEKAAAEAEMVVNGATASYGAVTNMSVFWRGRSEVTQFPLVDMSSCTNLSFAFEDCTGQVTVPAYDTSSVVSFRSTFFSNSSVVTMTSLDTSSGTNFQSMFFNCASLANFPANFFDDISGGDFNNAFTGTNLSEASIDNILVSLVASGIAAGTRRFDQSGGSAPSVGVGQPAIDTLRASGWTVNVTGGYTTP